MGESPLHHAAWHGLPAHVCYRLCLAGCDTSATNKVCSTPVLSAASTSRILFYLKNFALCMNLINCGVLCTVLYKQT